MNVEILLDTGAGGGSYISSALCDSLIRNCGLRMDRSASGSLRAANPSHQKVPPMRILGRVGLPVLFTNDSCVRVVPARVVADLPYAFIVRADYFKKNRSTLGFDSDEGFRPTPGAPWVPFLEHRSATLPPPVSALVVARTAFSCAMNILDRYGNLPNRDPVRPSSVPPQLASLFEPNPSPAPASPHLPSYQDIAWEDDSMFEWNVHMVHNDLAVQGFTSKGVEAAPVGPMPQDRQLVILLPSKRFDLESGATVGVARAVMWWTPGTPVYCKVVNTSKVDSVISGRPTVARMIALNVRDPARFDSLFDASPSAVDPPACITDTAPASPPSEPSVPPVPPPTVDVREANLGNLGALEKDQLIDVLSLFIEEGLFPIDPKRVPTCVDGELELPLINEFCTPFAAKQRRFSPEERVMIRAEIQKLLDRGIIRRSMSPWAAQCLCVRKKDGTLRLCIDWRELNKHLVTDSGGLGDMQTIFDGLKGKRYFSQLDLASGFHQLSIAEKDRHKTAFRDADGQLFEFTRAGFGLTVLPSAFTRTVKIAIGILPGVFSWLDDILVASDTWEQHLATLIVVLRRLLAAGLSVNFAKCIFGAASMEFLGMVIDSTGVFPAPSKLAAIAEMPRPHTVEELRVFLGLTGYLRQFVANYSITCAPLTDILRNKEFASKRARKRLIPWGDEPQRAFDRLKEQLASPTVLAYPDPTNQFQLHTDASTVGSGAALMQESGGTPRFISFASHRFSRTDSRRAPTERECMGILWAVQHFRPYLLGRQFKLITDCSALTWLFRSRDLCPKLHRWALRLMEYDMILEWKEGALHVLPDALSRLPLPSTTAGAMDVDDSFPDDGTSQGVDHFVGPQGPRLDGILLTDMYPEVAVGNADAPEIGAAVAEGNLNVAEQPVDAGVADTVEQVADNAGVTERSGVADNGSPNWLAAAAFSHVSASDLAAALNPSPRRSQRRRTPSVRLQPLDDLPAPVPLHEVPLTRAYQPTPVGTTLAPPPSAAPSFPASGDPADVLSAGGEVPQSATPAPMVPVDKAAEFLTNPATLCQQQRNDPLLSQVWDKLERVEKGANVTWKGVEYRRDDAGVIRVSGAKRKGLMAIPQCMVADILALVHSLQGHAGVGATLSLVRDHFHWPTVVKDTRGHVLSCGCRRRKRAPSRRVPMTSERSVEPWEELVIDLLAVDFPSESGNNYVLLVVDRASRFPFGFPLKSKGAVDVARVLAELCLTFGVPRAIRCDGGGEFRAEVVTHLCRWLKADIAFGPADHPRGQGSVERLGAWLIELLSELCQSWPQRWDEYVSPALWVKRTLPDLSLTPPLSPFELLFGRPPRTSLDSLVPTDDNLEASGGLDNFVERRKQNMREVRIALDKRNELRARSKAAANATISRPSPGITARKGDLVLVREAAASRHRDGRGRRLQHENYSGPWRVTRVLVTGLSVEVEMNARKHRTRTVAVADVKPFHLRPPALRHSLADEFAQHFWGPDFKSAAAPHDLTELTTLADCRRTRTPSGRSGWEYKGRTSAGVEGGWVSEGEALKSFTSLQLDTFVALRHLYNPEEPVSVAHTPASKPSAPSRRDALQMYPLGTRVRKDFGGGLVLDGVVFDFRDRYWRVRYSDNNWEELTKTEIKRILRS